MLIRYRLHEDGSVKLGIAVKQWFIKNEPRIYVLLPSDSLRQCEVDVIYEPAYEWDISIVEKSFTSPRLEKNVFDKLDEDVEESLYLVWDDGATTHPDRAVKLYEYFESQIEQDRGQAITLRSQLVEETYRLRLSEARANGWDIDIIKKDESNQSYGSIDVA